VSYNVGSSRPDRDRALRKNFAIASHELERSPPAQDVREHACSRVLGVGSFHCPTVSRVDQKRSALLSAKDDAESGSTQGMNQDEPDKPESE
jgi:hypothetical protein